MSLYYIWVHHLCLQLQSGDGQNERIGGDQREAAGVSAGGPERRLHERRRRRSDGDQTEKSGQAQVVGRQDGGAGHRLAVHQLQLVRGLLQGLRGRVHGGRAQYTAGHGVRDARQRRANRWPVHGHTAGDRVQLAGHVQARVHGIVFGSVPDGRQGGEHVCEPADQCSADDNGGGLVGHRGRLGVVVARAARVHAHRSGHGCDTHGRPHTDSHVRVPVGRRVHYIVRDAGQWIYGGCGHSRGYVPDERVAGRQDRWPQWSVPDCVHVLRHRHPRERYQPRYHHYILHNRCDVALLQSVPEGVHQQTVFYTRSHRAHHHHHRRGALPVHHYFC